MLLFSPHHGRGRKETTSHCKDSPAVEKAEKKQPEPSPPQQRQEAASHSQDKKPPQQVKKEVKKVAAPKKQQKPEPAEETTKTKEITVEEVEAARKKIEEEMIKRRERLATWRAAREKEEEENKPKQEDEREEEGEEEEGTKRKGWTLEDDDDDEDADSGEAMEQGKGEESGEEVDPLDAFMMGVGEDVKKASETKQKKEGATMIKVTKVKQKAKNGKQVKKGKKGELMLNDQDAMEYSDDEDDGDEELMSALSAIMKKTRKKEVPTVDHKKIEYAPFRKDFYREVPELAEMTPEEVSAYRIELENVKIKGKGCPKPVRSWAQCGLSARVLEVIKRQNYEKPTPIQAQAIPAIMSGRDVIGIAKTGSGKTLAFLLPLIRHVKDQDPLDYEEGPIAIILTPTRELAIQIYNECRKFCKPLKLTAVCVYGGTGISEQIADLKRGADIVVCTPGRMIDMLAANNGRVTNLRRTTYVVLDEADRMFDMGFEPQVMRIVTNVRPSRQMVMFSATFPRQMEALARKILTQPIEVQVGGRSVVCKDVEQDVVVLDDDQKFFKLLELLGQFQEKGSVLAFVERQESADHLIRDLMKAGYPCMALHGGMDQSDRDSTISDFRSGDMPLLVATSVAARGLDVKQLILVVNYDCPNHYEDYVHRCGRTGRAGRKGNACTILTPEQARLSGEIIKALELSGAKVPPEVDELWKSYIEQMKAEGKYNPKKRPKAASGFSGKGFKFNDEEDAKVMAKKLQQKSSLGTQDGDEDDDEIAMLTLDKKLEEVFSGKPRFVDPSTPQVPLTAADKKLNPSATKSLAKAAAIAGKLVLSKNLVATGGPTMSAAQTAASNVLKGGQVSVTGAALASQIAVSINAKVGAGRAKASKAFLPVGTIVPNRRGQGDDDDDSDEDSWQPEVSFALAHFEEQIEINDFPQQIRFRITSRDLLDDIGESCDAYVSVRGLYIPIGKQPKEGERRLHLLIEAKSERSVSLAKQEIKQSVKEEAQRLASRLGSFRSVGRYKV